MHHGLVDSSRAAHAPSVHKGVARFTLTTAPTQIGPYFADGPATWAHHPDGMCE